MMKSSQNHPFNFLHRAVETSEISLAWAITGGRQSPCEDVWINFWKHGAEPINVTAGAFSGFSEPPPIKTSVAILAQRQLSCDGNSLFSWLYFKVLKRTEVW